jgi:predicted ATPase
MKLVRLTLDSYRAFDFADVKIPESGITLIAGSNNSGKTAFLSAIDFVGRGDRYPDEHNLATGRPARIEARFRLSADESSKLLRSTIGHSSFSSTTLQEVSWRFSELRGTLTATEIVTWWSPGDEIVLARITPVESNGIRLETVNVGEGGKRPNFELVYRSETTPGDTNILRTTGFIGELGILGDWLNEWAANTYHFKSLRPGSASDTYPGRADAKLTPTGENLPAALNHLLHNEPMAYNRLKDAIQRIVPGVGELQLPQVDDRIRVDFRESRVGGSSLNLKSLGAGVEQLLMALFVGLTGDGASGIIIEEPETSLHPGAQRALLEMMQEWATDRPYIIATHSPVFLDTTERSQILLVTRRSGRSEIQPIGQDSRETLNELGVRLSDVLSASRILLVEGETEERLLHIWFPEHLKTSRLAIVQTIGGDSVRHARHFQRWITSADQLGDRKVLFLRDRDELAPADLQFLESTGLVHVLDGREIENYLLDETALTITLEQKLARNIDSHEVETILRELADGLKRLVILKRVCRRLPAVRLVDNRTRRKLARANAGPDELHSEVILRLREGELLASKISEYWAEEESLLLGTWESNWRRLAPGEELLEQIWEHYQLGGYSKLADGPAIAANMAQPPSDLRKVLTEFVREDGDEN